MGIVKDSETTVKNFNIALEALLELFPKASFDRTEKLSLIEVLSQSEPLPIFYRTTEDSPHSMNVSYQPSMVYNNPKPRISVRAYRKEDTLPVLNLFRDLDLDPLPHEPHELELKRDVYADLA